MFFNYVLRQKRDFDVQRALLYGNPCYGIWPLGLLGVNSIEDKGQFMSRLYGMVCGNHIYAVVIGLAWDDLLLGIDTASVLGI